MQRLKQIFGLFFLVLVLIPIADKAWDQYSHFTQDHCEDVRLHFCVAEHHCDVCDYVFSAGSSLPQAPELSPLFDSELPNYQTEIKSEFFSRNNTTPYLRGPPSCA